MIGTPRLGYALIAGGALLAAVAGWSAWRGAAGLRSAGSPQADAASVARDFVLAAGAFDADTSGDYLARLSALSGGELRSALTGARVDPSAIAAGRSVQTDVAAVSLETSRRDEAIALVTATQQRRWWGEAGAVVTEQVRQQLRLRLVREGGRWLVTQLDVTNQQAIGREAGQ